MKRKIILPLVIFTSLIVGVSVKYFRKNNLKKYHSTAQCEKAELNYCKKTFKIGGTLSNFKNKLHYKNIEIFTQSKSNSTELIQLKNILKKCQLSGRQYCGIFFKFKNGKLISIYTGYPCH